MNEINWAIHFILDNIHNIPKKMTIRMRFVCFIQLCLLLDRVVYLQNIHL